MRKPFSIPSLVLCPTWDDSTASSSPAPTRHNATSPRLPPFPIMTIHQCPIPAQLDYFQYRFTIRTAIFTTDDVLLRFVSTQIHVLQQSGCSVVLDLCGFFYFETRIGLFSITWNKTLFLHPPLKNFFHFFPIFKNNVVFMFALTSVWIASCLW